MSRSNARLLVLGTVALATVSGFAIGVPAAKERGRASIPARDENERARRSIPARGHPIPALPNRPLQAPWTPLVPDPDPGMTRPLDPRRWPMWPNDPRQRPGMPLVPPLDPNMIRPPRLGPAPPERILQRFWFNGYEYAIILCEEPGSPAATGLGRSTPPAHPRTPSSAAQRTRVR